MTSALLLSTRERYAVTAGLVLALVPPLAGLSFVTLQPPLRAVMMSVAVIVLSSASMPLLSDIAQRAVLRGPLVRLGVHVALALTHLAALFLTMLAVLTIAGVDLDLDQLGAMFVQTAQSGLFCYAATIGVIRAIQWYRSASLAEEERRALETAQLEKARDLVEETLRPGMVGEALHRIRDLLPDRPTEAERAVKRLARHGRMLTSILAEGGATVVSRLRTLRSVLLLHGVDVELDVDLDAARGVPRSLRTFAATIEEIVEPKPVLTSVPGPPLCLCVSVLNPTVPCARESIHHRDTEAQRGTENSMYPGAIAMHVSASGQGAPRFIDELTAVANAHGWTTTATAADLHLLLPDDPPAQPAPAQPLLPVVRYSGSVYTWVVGFVGVATIVNLYATTLPSARLTTWTEVAAAFLWLLVALPLIRLAERIVTLRRWLAAPALLGTAWLAGTAVSLLAIRIAAAYTEAMSIPIPSAPLGILPFAARHNVLIACAIAGVSFSFANGRQLLAAQASVGRMRQALASAELRNLEARIQPHFLFNALVSLLALIRLDPARAAGMCDLLSDLFARSVAASGVHEWPLREEIALTTDYLAVQHIRFGERLVVRTTVHPDLHARLIPRLLLQPLVENAVKHGVARREEPTHLTIAASERRGALHLEVVNDSGLPAVGPPAAGGGLTFVRSRVAAAGGTVDYDAPDPGTFRVCCVLPAVSHSLGVP